MADLVNSETHPEARHELRHVEINPKPRPSIDIILVTGQHNDILVSCCNRMASTWDFYHLSVDNYLEWLLQHSRPGDKALGGIHPGSLRQVLTAGRQVPAVFLVDILHQKIDRKVDEGCRSFIISGLGENLEAVEKFAAEIAEPKALVAFDWPNERVSEQRAAIEARYRSISFDVTCVDDDAEATFKRLMAVMYDEARH